MVLDSLTVSGVRNISDCKIDLHHGINFVFGANGSGKTSLLEAISLYWEGKSFRASSIEEVISSASESLLIAGKSLQDHDNIHFGMEYHKSTKVRRVKFDGEVVKRSSEVAAILPIFYVSPQYSLFSHGSPSIRRSLFFWFMFHVEHGFSRGFSTLSKSVKARNVLLKRLAESSDTNSGTDSELTWWEQHIASCSTELRQMADNAIVLINNSITDLNDLILESMPQLNGVNLLQEFLLTYPWNKGDDLKVELKAMREADSLKGYTSKSFQYVDFKTISTSKLNIKSLSRGEDKSLTLQLVLCMLLALHKLNIRPLFLIDDFPSEFDGKHQDLIISIINRLSLQCIITFIKKEDVEEVSRDIQNFKVFHVKHGSVIEEQNVRRKQ